jgi:hypothetical protein
MNIHEYQAKALLHEFGVPISKGVPVLKPEDAEAAAKALPGPIWVVKSQIHAGGRGKGKFKEASAGDKGGVRIAKSPAEVGEFAKQMLGATLVTIQTGAHGKQVNVSTSRKAPRSTRSSISPSWSTARPARSPSSSRPKAASTSRTSPTTRRKRSPRSRSIPRPASWAITAAPSPRR